MRAAFPALRGFSSASWKISSKLISERITAMKYIFLMCIFHCAATSKYTISF
jgi:hypothetical protein